MGTFSAEYQRQSIPILPFLRKQISPGPGGDVSCPPVSTVPRFPGNVIQPRKVTVHRANRANRNSFTVGVAASTGAGPHTPPLTLMLKPTSPVKKTRSP